MPIRADLKALYPDNWPEISHRIRFVRADGRCETCTRPHGNRLRCLPDGRWRRHGSAAWFDGVGKPCAVPSVEDLERIRDTYVVLTTAHLDHDPSNNHESNLAALCQRCHLRHDSVHHMGQRRLTYALRSAIGDLFDGLYSLAGYPRNTRQQEIEVAQWSIEVAELIGLAAERYAHHVAIDQCQRLMDRMRVASGQIRAKLSAAILTRKTKDAYGEQLMELEQATSQVRNLLKALQLVRS